MGNWAKWRINVSPNPKVQYNEKNAITNKSKRQGNCISEHPSPYHLYLISEIRQNKKIEQVLSNTN